VNQPSLHVAGKWEKSACELLGYHTSIRAPGVTSHPNHSATATLSGEVSRMAAAPACVSVIDLSSDQLMEN